MAIRFPIVTTFDDKAVGKADKAFSALGKKFAAIFSVGAVIKFGKDSVKAFQDAEKEANLLRAQLESINLGFASPFVNQYIDNLALLSGISGGVLTDAFNSLSQATQDVTTAQKLLNTSLDIAAGTGKDLRTVTSALQRAYLGETTALAKLRIGYTTADLKARDFDEVLAELQNKFQGSSAKAADTLAGKMARLTESVEQAQEAFGEGLVKGLQDSQVEIDQLQQDVIGLGDALGYAAGQATGFFAKAFQDIVKDFEESDGAFQKFVRSLVKSTAEITRLEEERGRAGLRARNRILKAEQSITKTKKEQDKLSEKEKKNALAIAKAKAVFDIEKIQIEAALRGKITEEERTRLLLMKAILEEDAGAARRLQSELNDLQTSTQRLSDTLSNISKMPSPFSFWKDDVVAAIDAINDGMKKSVTDFIADFRSQIRQVPQEVMAQSLASQGEADMMLGDYYAALAELGESKAALELAYSQFSGNLVSGLNITQKRMIDAYFREGRTDELIDPVHPGVDLMSIVNAIRIREEGIKAIKSAAEAIQAQELSVAALGGLAAEAAARAADDLLQESILGNLNLGLTPSMNINVNVEGSVISAEDLAETITDIQYQYQRTGKGLLLSSTGL
jgi:hypothetical protein